VPENGTETFVIEAVDFAGKVGTAKKTVTFVNNRPELAGTCNALLISTGPPQLGTTGLVTVTVMASGNFTGKYCLSNSTVPFTGVLLNDGTARFTPWQAAQLALVDKMNGYLGALSFSVSAAQGITGTLSTQTGGSALAAFAAQRAVRDASAVSPHLLNFPAVSPTRGVYTVVFPAGTSTTVDPVAGPQGDGYASLVLLKSGLVLISGYLADGTQYITSGTLRLDGTVPLFRPLYDKRGVFAGALAFADLPDSDLTGPGFLWFRPAATVVNTFRAGWPSGLTIGAIGAKYAAPAACDFGQGTPDVDRGNSALVFNDGLLPATVTSPVSIDPATGAVKLIPTAPTPATLLLTPGNGFFSGAFTRDGLTDKYSGILLHKGANRGGFGFFVRNPLIFGADLQSGGVSLQPRPEE
jgi:hypothetical protein